jgi:SAM-dependent methyltransferase
MNANLETIACPYCGGADAAHWAQEIGFNAVRCRGCALIYVNPRPSLALISQAVRTGAHGAEAGGLKVVSRRNDYKVGRYRRILGRLFEDVWQRGQPVSWVDVGAGYGEVVEAVAALAPAGSSVEGREPMQPKAAAARARGLPVVHGYLTADHDKVDFVSVVDVFSHIPDFSSFLELIRAVLKPGGEVFIETGNLADLGERNEFPGELGLPDHLVFAGEAQLRGYLERAGFELVKLEGEAVDDWLNLVKNVVKKLLGRPVKLAWPFTSRYRQLLVRARLRPVG